MNWNTQSSIEYRYASHQIGGHEAMVATLLIKQDKFSINQLLAITNVDGVAAALS